MKNITYKQLKEILAETAAEIYKRGKNIYEIKIDNARRATITLYNFFYDSPDRFYRYENVAFDCTATYDPKLSYSDFLSAYKKRDFDEQKEALLLRQSKEKAFRFLLNEYIVNFKSRQINERKNLYFDITPQGKFVAIKKTDEKPIVCDLSASERTLFNFLCFIEINKFRQFVNGIKDFNYREKPLILISFPDYLDRSLDYVSFLKEQNLNREIIIISDIKCTKNAASNSV